VEDDFLELGDEYLDWAPPLDTPDVLNRLNPWERVLTAHVPDRV
jgi:hypothetical protein